MDPGEGDSRDVVQSSDFAAILSGFRECGYSVSYRVLDSQYFGVPQRRRRVFVVGHLGDDWRPSAAVLFERDSLRRDLTPSRAERQEAAASAGDGAEVSGPNDLKCYGFDSLSSNSPDPSKNQGGNLILHCGNRQRQSPAAIANTLDTKFGTKMGLENQHIDSGASMFVPFEKEVKCFQQNGLGEVIENDNAPTSFGAQNSHHQGLSYGDITPSLDKSKVPAVTHDAFCIQTGQVNANGSNINKEQSFTLNKNDKYAIATHIARRLTPMECLRLQGFPDDYLDLPKALDSAKYAAIGNSMTTHVITWILRRIALFESLTTSI
jgi:DNA (cytosine-5)-methyltransferase 1